MLPPVLGARAPHVRPPKFVRASNNLNPVSYLTASPAALGFILSWSPSASCPTARSSAPTAKASPSTARCLPTSTPAGAAAPGRTPSSRAAQVWAQQTNLNFAVVADDGSILGDMDSYQQGDPGFGDIRIGGSSPTPPAPPSWPAPTCLRRSTTSPSPATSSSTPITLFNIGSTYDLFTVAAHEFGHALGLDHGAVTAVMADTYPGTKTDLSADDTSGIRAIYSAGLARTADINDIGGNNNSFTSATVIPIDVVTKTGQLADRDITVTTDNDYFKITIPSRHQRHAEGQGAKRGAEPPGLEAVRLQLVVRAEGLRQRRRPVRRDAERQRQRREPRGRCTTPR